MYEVWVSNEDPTLHMVRKVGSDASAAVELRLWSRLGETNKVSPEVAREVEADGHSTVTLGGSVFDPEQEIKRAPSGPHPEQTAREVREVKLPGSG